MCENNGLWEILKSGLRALSIALFERNFIILILMKNVFSWNKFSFRWVAEMFDKLLNFKVICDLIPAHGALLNSGNFYPRKHFERLPT